MLFKKSENELVAPFRSAALDARGELKTCEAAATALAEQLDLTKGRIKAVADDMARLAEDRTNIARQLATGEITPEEFDATVEADATLTARHAALTRAADLLAQEVESARQRMNEARGKVKKADGRLAAAMADALIAKFLDDYRKATALLCAANRTAGLFCPTTEAVSRHVGAMKEAELIDIARQILADELR